MANSVNEIIEEIKKGMTGDIQKDAVYLEEKMIFYRNDENAEEILARISSMAFDMMPEDKKEYLRKTMFIGDKRLDEVFNEANELFKVGKLKESADLMQKIEEKADAYANDPENKNNFSFRNRFDEYLYRELFKPEKNFYRTPYDICTYMSAYGYVLVELGRAEEAESVLKKAIRFNPVNIGPRFELAETYKLRKLPAKLLETIKETVPVCTSPEDIARCYCNLGYYCIEIKDYDSAVAFYYTSVVYAPNDNIRGEIDHIAAIKGKQITPPTLDDIAKAFKKYRIKEGPNPVVINMAYSLGEYCVEHGAHPQESLYYYSIAYNLTRDEKIKEKLDKLVEEARDLAGQKSEKKDL